MFLKIVRHLLFGEPKNDKEDALCRNHDDVITTTAAIKPCPECGKRMIVTNFNRCSKCAKKSSKCQLCDGQLK